MDTLLKKSWRKRIRLAFFVALFVVGGGFSLPSSVQAQTCASLGGTCSSSLCVSPSVSLNGTCGDEEVCCGPRAGGGPLVVPVSPICSVQGGTCRSTCQSGETSSGACTGVSGGTCCMPGGGATNSNSTPITFANPLQYDTVEEVLNSLLGTLQGIIVILSLVFIVIGAVLYITSAGNDKQMTMAKGAITASMIGLAIGLAAPSFLKEIGTVLGWGAVDSSAVAGARTLSQIARSVLDFLLSIVGVLAIIMLVVGGIMYLTAAGNEDQIDSGKKIVKYSIIGIAVALAALVIVSQIAAFFV